MRLTQPPLQLDRVANCCWFNGVIGFAHARGQLRKLLPAELALSIELMCKTDHAELFFRGATLDLIDNLLCRSMNQPNLDRRGAQRSQRYPEIFYVLRVLCGWSYGIRY